MTNIHASAIIGERVQLGKNVTIGPYCVIGDGAVIHDDVVLKSHVITEGRVTIGQGTKVFPFASFSYPQTPQFEGEDSEIIIGKNNTIREYVTIQHGTAKDKMLTRIGDNCLFMVGVHIAHNCVVGNNVVFANYVSLAGHVQVDDYAIIGGLSAVQQFCRVGAHSMTGGLTAIVKNLIPYGLAANERASLEGLNLVGMNRRGFDKQQSLQASKALKELFAQENEQLFAERVTRMQADYPDNKIIQEIGQFINDDTNTKKMFVIPKKT